MGSLFLADLSDALEFVYNASAFALNRRFS